MRRLAHFLNLHPRICAGVFGFCAFLLYALTGARTIQWQDSAQFTYRVVAGELGNEYGLAMVHPLHFWVGRLVLWLFPGPDPWAVSVVSALGGGVAVGLVFACIRHITGMGMAASFGAGSLMLAHTFWRFSGLPEVYTLSAALLLAQVMVYLRIRESEDPRRWWILFALNGLAFSNHNLALLSVSVWGILFLRWGCSKRGDPNGTNLRQGGRAVPALFQRRDAAATLQNGPKLAPFWADPFCFWRHLVMIAAWWGLGSLPYTGLILLEMIREGEVVAVLRTALFGESFQQQVLSLRPAMHYTLISLGFLVLSFPGACVPLGIRELFSITGKRSRLPGPVVAVLGLHLLFFLRYPVIDQYTFLIPAFGLVALVGGVGYASLRRPLWRRVGWVLLCLQPLVYAMVPWVAQASGVLTAFERAKPYRDDYRYLFWPWQVAERSADRLAREAFDAVGSGGVLVVEDPMVEYTLAWMRRERGLEAEVSLSRPPELDGLLESEAQGTIIWVPARSDTPPPEGWRKRGEVWGRRNQ